MFVFIKKMNMFRAVIIATILVTVVIETHGQTSSTAMSGSTCYLKNADAPTKTLEEAEKSGLLYLREEEKLARDLYIELNKKHQLLNLSHISKSEQVHMDAIHNLIRRYDLEDPVREEYGLFTNTKLQRMYTDLLKRGLSSKTETLMAGALVEETDINDLQKELDSNLDNEDIRTVYLDLLRASYNHLRSFVCVLALNGIEYKPVILDMKQFNSIMNQ